MTTLQCANFEPVDSEPESEPELLPWKPDREPKHHVWEPENVEISKCFAQFTGLLWVICPVSASTGLFVSKYVFEMFSDCSDCRLGPDKQWRTCRPLSSACEHIDGSQNSVLASQNGSQNAQVGSQKFEIGSQNSFLKGNPKYISEFLIKRESQNQGIFDLSEDFARSLRYWHCCGESHGFLTQSPYPKRICKFANLRVL